MRGFGIHPGVNVPESHTGKIFYRVSKRVVYAGVFVRRIQMHTLVSVKDITARVLRFAIIQHKENVSDILSKAIRN